MDIKEASHVLELVREECMKRPELVKERHRSELQHGIVQACEQINESPKDHLVMDKLQEERPAMLTGHCYVASEAFHHLVGGVPHFIRHEGSPHWYLSLDFEIVDPTVEQFETEPQYDEGVGKGFLTSEPSKRAQEIIESVKQRLTDNANGDTRERGAVEERL